MTRFSTRNWLSQAGRTFWSLWKSLEHGKKHSILYFYFGGLAPVLALGSFAFSRIGGAVFFSWDSASYIAFANETLANGMPLQLGPSYNQSLGNVTFPADFWLLPEAILSFHDGKIDSLLFYLIVAALFYSCTFIALVLFGFGRWMALIVACTFTLLTLPYSSPVLHTELYWWHAPFMIPAVYMAFALITSYYLIGRLPTLLNFIAVVLFGVAVVWTIAGYPKQSAVIFLGLSLFFFIFTVGCQSWRELSWKLAGPAIVLAFVISSGPWNFIRGIYGNTSNAVLATMTLTESGDASWSGMLSTLFHPAAIWFWTIPGNLIWVKYHMGYLLPALALIGAAWAIISPIWPRPVKLLAIVILLIFPFSFISIYGSAYVAQVNYFLFAFAFIPAVDLVRVAASRLSNIEQGAPLLKDRAEFVGIGAVATLVLLAGIGMRRDRFVLFRYPPQRPAVVEFLKEKIGFSAGMQFRGRYLNLMHLGDFEFSHGDSTAQTIIDLSATLARKEFNDLTFSNMRYDDIPVTIELNRMSTPLSTVFHNVLLVRAGDVDRIDYRVVTIYDPKLLGLIGVRYVLSAAAPSSPDVSVVMKHPLVSYPDIDLHEITVSNHGQYSPTSVHLVSDIGESLHTLASSNFDPRKQALIHSDSNVLAQTLVPAREVTIRRVRNGLNVRGLSDGWSFVVLPFEFSRCLMVEPIKGNPPQSVERADLILTGVFFDRETEFDLKFVFGPFRNSDCRLHDMLESRAMNLRVEALSSLRTQFPGKLNLTGFY